MSLSTKIAAILTVLILSLTAIGATVQNRVFGRIFSSIESEEAGLELLRVQSALEAEIDACARSARRVATHDRTRAFAAQPGGREGYLAENLSTAALRGDDLDLLYVCTAGGDVLGGTILDPITGELTQLSRDFPGGRLAPEHPAFAGRGSLPRGMITTARGPMLIGTARVQAPPRSRLDSSGSRPSATWRSTRPPARTSRGTSGRRRRGHPTASASRQRATSRSRTSGFA